jgi:hypothetical protein
MTDVSVRAGAVALYAWTRQEPFEKAQPHFDKLPDLIKSYFDHGARAVIEAANEETIKCFS